MTTEEALIAAVLADRAADMPRLAYADWLEENGQGERAEFIRVQVEIARWERQEVKDSMLHPLRELHRREQVLRYIGDVEQNWWPSFTGITFPEISRGFAPCVRASWADWLAYHEVILKRQPIEKVTLTTIPTEFAGRGDGEARWLASHWPRIEFALPPALRHIGTYRGRHVYAGATIGTPYRDYRAAENL